MATEFSDQLLESPYLQKPFIALLFRDGDMRYWSKEARAWLADKWADVDLQWGEGDKFIPVVNKIERLEPAEGSIKNVLWYDVVLPKKLKDKMITGISLFVSSDGRMGVDG